MYVVSVCKGIRCGMIVDDGVPVCKCICCG